MRRFLVWILGGSLCALLIASLISRAAPTPGPWWAVPACLHAIGLIIIGGALRRGRRRGTRFSERSRRAMQQYLAFSWLAVAIAYDRPTWITATLIAVLLALAVACLLPTIRLHRELVRWERLIRATPTRENADALIGFARARPHPALRAFAAGQLLGPFPGDAGKLYDELLAEVPDAPSELAPWFHTRLHELRLLRAWAASRLDDRDSARAALAALPAVLEPKHETTRRLIQSCLLSWEGHGAEALSLVPDDDAPSLFPRYAPIARAHAYAAMGDREAARSILAKLDRAALRGVTRGPAATLAAEMLAGTAQPYR